MGRPAGRRWARLRRSGSRATEAFVRVARRRREPGTAALASGAQVVYPPAADRPWRRIAARRGPEARHRTTRTADARTDALAPVSPAVGPTSLRTSGAGPATIGLLPGERTLLRRVPAAS